MYLPASARVPFSISLLFECTRDFVRSHISDLTSINVISHLRSVSEKRDDAGRGCGRAREPAGPVSLSVRSVHSGRGSVRCTVDRPECIPDTLWVLFVCMDLGPLLIVCKC